MKWDLTNLYENLESWQEDFENAQAMLKDIPSYRGKLGEFEQFKTYYKLQKDAVIKLHKLYQYASLKSDLNKKDVENAARVQKMSHLVHEFSQATSFEKPEILSLGYKKVESFLDQDETLKEYRFPMQKLFHQSEHILDADKEALMGHYRQLSSQGASLHSSLSVADGEATTVTLKDGTEIHVTQGNFRSYLADLQDKDDRETVFKAIFDHFSKHKHTYADIYNTVLQADIAHMKSRQYNSSLESYLHGNNIDPVVYHNLIDVAKSSTDLLKRYYKIRKDELGLDEHRTFDRFMPLAEGTSKFSYDEAKDLFFKSLDHLDEDFKDKAYDALKEGYVDVFEQDGKRTGAYSSSVVNEHPFILLNFDGTLGDVFTVAHEAGHSMHSLFAKEMQPVATQSYTIFVAEIASTFNEHLLLDYFIDNNKGSKEDKIQLLQQSIDDIAATFYRQTLFAAYELKAHELAEKGEPITHEVLTNIMKDLYLEFYDIDITKEPGKSYVWAYIPHMFFTPFYVYQYATSFAASLKLYDMVKADPSNIENHMKLLKSGGNNFPMEQVKASGLDLTDKSVFEAVVSRLSKLLDELEVALKS